MWCSCQHASTNCTAAVLSGIEVIMKPLICNHGNNSAVIPFIKSRITPGVLEPDRCSCKSHGDTHCLQQHIFSWKTVSGFPASTSAVKTVAPLWISCWNSMWHLQFPERRVMAFQLWLWGNNHHRQEVETTWNWTPQWMYMKRHCTWALFWKKKQNRQARLGAQQQANMLLTEICTCTKKPRRHVSITAAPSSEPFIINRGNHGRLLIGDALVGVSEVSGVLSLSICKLPQLGKKPTGRRTFMCTSCWLWRI